jgi:hypothetical protein
VIAITFCLKSDDASVCALFLHFLWRSAMSEHDPKIELTAQEARGGKELGVMRYVLHISLALAVIAGIIIYIAVRG